MIQLLLITALASVHAIYPDDHWKFSTKLTKATFSPSIQAEIEADKTVFVRWIASEG